MQKLLTILAFYKPFVIWSFLVNIAITIVNPYNDLGVAILPLSAPRPGFTYQNRITYTNNGNQIMPSGSVTFNKDPLVTIIGNTQSEIFEVENDLKISVKELKTKNESWFKSCLSLPKTESELLEELATSPVIYLERSATDFVAVNITNTSYEIKTFLTDRRLFNVSFDIEYTYSRYRQSL